MCFKKRLHTPVIASLIAVNKLDFIVLKERRKYVLEKVARVLISLRLDLNRGIYLESAVVISRAWECEIAYIWVAACPNSCCKVFAYSYSLGRVI